MALKVFPYTCQCGHSWDAYVRYRGEPAQCAKCGTWVQKARLGATATTFKFADKSGMKRG